MVRGYPPKFWCMASSTSLQSLITKIKAQAALQVRKLLLALHLPKVKGLKFRVLGFIFTSWALRFGDWSLEFYTLQVVGKEH